MASGHNDVVVYQNVVTNYGPGVATNIVTTNDPHSSNSHLTDLSWVEVSSGIIIAHGTGALSETIASLAPGSSVIFYTAATIGAGAPAIIPDTGSIVTHNSTFQNTNSITTSPHPMASSTNNGTNTTVTATVDIDPKTDWNHANAANALHVSHMLDTSPNSWLAQCLNDSHHSLPTMHDQGAFHEAANAPTHSDPTAHMIHEMHFHHHHH
jgi:hypothetical protein